MAGKIDKYTNQMALRVAMSAANTLTFNELVVGLNVFDKVGLLISRVDYQLNGPHLTEMTTVSDQITCGVSQSNTWPQAVLTEQSLIDIITLWRVDLGVAASAQVIKLPIVNDLSTQPGGGILIVPRPLFFFMVTSGLATAGVVDIRIYFTVVDLKPDEYFELLEARQFFG